MKKNRLYVENWGEVIIETIFQYYEEPLIFLANTADRKNILFMLTDFDPRKWLAIFLTSEEIRRLSKSSVDTRSLFTEAGREIYRLCEKENKKISEKKITLKDISTEDLPDEGVFIGNKEELAIEDNFTTEDITGFKKGDSINLSLR